jgi:hypothetical protein
MFRLAERPGDAEASFSVTVAKRGRLARGEDRSKSFTVLAPKDKTAEEIRDEIRAHVAADTQHSQ